MRLKRALRWRGRARKAAPAAVAGVAAVAGAVSPLRRAAAWALCAGLLSAAAGALAQTATMIAPGQQALAPVAAVSDGDTIWVGPAGQAERVRLFGVDAPEKSQPWGAQSKAALEAMAKGKTVLVQVFFADRYGRMVAKVWIPGPQCAQAQGCSSWIDANYEQVKAGNAWHYAQYAKDQPAADREAYGQAQREAMQARRGLWSEPNPEAPWDYRHRTEKAEAAQEPAAQR